MRKQLHIHTPSGSSVCDGSHARSRRFKGRGVVKGGVSKPSCPTFHMDSATRTRRRSPERRSVNDRIYSWAPGSFTYFDFRSASTRAPYTFSWAECERARERTSRGEGDACLFQGTTLPELMFHTCAQCSSLYRASQVHCINCGRNHFIGVGVLLHPPPAPLLWHEFSHSIFTTKLLLASRAWRFCSICRDDFRGAFLQVSTFYLPLHPNLQDFIYRRESKNAAISTNEAEKQSEESLKYI